MRNEDSLPHGQHLACGESNRGENSRSGFQTPSHFVSPQCSTNPSRISPTSHRFLDDQRRSSSPPTITEHHFGLPSPPRRPTGTFEYGHTYGSSTYRHDQSTFLGTPKLPTRYQPDHASFRQHNRQLHDNRRRQFSPFVHFPRYQDKSTQDETSERLTQKGPATPSEENRGREFPVNHDWEDSSPFQEAPQPIGMLLL